MARIGAVLSTWNDGIVSAVNDHARSFGARIGIALKPESCTDAGQSVSGS